MGSLPVVFLFPEGEAGLAGIDVDRDWRFFGSGLRAWVAQTYLRLREAGHPVSVAPDAPSEGLVVYHPDYCGPGGRAGLRGLGRRITVAIRADRRPQDGADFEIVQNGCFADGRRIHFRPHWPQPGLIPRDDARGTRLESIAFKGHDLELHADLGGEKWLGFLAGAELDWIVDAAPYKGPSVDYSVVHWNDYREVDLVLALRPRDRALSMGTPATKLQNAWAAGVPALLGPELAYRELRRSELDYIEVAGAGDAIEAVRFLRDHPSTYRAMVENGRARFEELAIPRLVEGWAALLFETIPAAAATRRARLRRRVPGLALTSSRRVRERALGALARLRLRLGR